MRFCARYLLLLVAVGSFAAASPAQRPDQAKDIEGLLKAGEFAAAANVVAQVPEQNRDAFLAQIASAQSGSGETVAAGTTMLGMQSPAGLDGAVANEGAAQGGGSFADFQSLIDLIQTTVVPDTWEALGGPSTMAPYPQGVYVDASGTLKECEAFAVSDGIADIKSMLARSDSSDNDLEPLAWRSPSDMRCVSLRRLHDQWRRWQHDGLAPSEAMMNMAGLSRIQYVFFEDGDIVIAGPVGGIDSHQGWYRDGKTGLNTMRFDFLRTCLQSSLSNAPFGCTIDPTQQGLQQAADVGAAIHYDRLPLGKAVTEVIAALGMQRVEVFGTAGDSPLGYVMVEADRHMKQLALGIHPMPRGAMNYLDAIDDAIAKGPPRELLLRLWFTAAEQAVRAGDEKRVFELAGTPIRLSGQNERAMADGQRGNITRDFRTEAFVADFNKNWPSIRNEYPIYGSLESIYQSAAVSELIRRYGEKGGVLALANRVAADSSQDAYVLPTPRQVKSIAVMHTVRHGKKRHTVLLASGGVSVDAKQTLAARPNSYPSLASIRKPSQSAPVVEQRWWWNASQ